MKRIVILLIAILCLALYASAQDGTDVSPDGQTRLPAGVLTWDKYGLYLTLSGESVLTCNEDFNQTIEMDDLIVDVLVLDRLTYSDRQLGECVIEALKTYEVPIAEVHGGPISPNDKGIKGVSTYGPGKVGDTPATIGVVCLLDPDTSLAFLVMVLGVEESAVHEVCGSLGISTPQEHKVR